MKTEIEKEIQDWLKSLQYKGEQITDNFIRGATRKPKGSSNTIINFFNPTDKITQKLRKQNIIVEGRGILLFMFKRDDLPDAEERNDIIPDHVFNQMRIDSGLGERINKVGECIPVNLIQGTLELEDEEDWCFMSKLDFIYKGLYIPPTLTEDEPEP